MVRGVRGQDGPRRQLYWVLEVQRKGSVDMLVLESLNWNNWNSNSPRRRFVRSWRVFGGAVGGALSRTFCVAVCVDILNYVSIRVLKSVARLNQYRRMGWDEE